MLQLRTVVIIQTARWRRMFGCCTSTTWSAWMTRPARRRLVGSRRMEIWATTLVRHHPRKLSTSVRLSKLMSSSASILVLDGLICTHFSSLYVLLSRSPVYGTLWAGPDWPKPNQKFCWVGRGTVNCTVNTNNETLLNTIMARWHNGLIQLYTARGCTTCSG